MRHTQISDQINIISQSDRQLSILVPSLYHDKERTAILQTLLLKREAIEKVETETKKNVVSITYDPEKLAMENLLNLLANVLKHFSQKPSQKIVIHNNHANDNKSTYEIFFRVNNMSCESCALFLEMVLSRQTDVIQARIDFNSKMGNVAGYLNKDKVFEIIKKHGYQADSIDTKDYVTGNKLTRKHLNE